MTNLGEWKQAIRVLHDALREDPSNETALYELAFCYDKEGRIQEAEAFYRRSMMVCDDAEKERHRLALLTDDADAMRKEMATEFADREAALKAREDALLAAEAQLEAAFVMFDTEKILSAGVDNTLRQWLWAQESDRGKVSDKFHVYDAGDTLVSIARQYGVSLPEVIRWNAIEDVRKVFPGTRLIVQPVSYTHLTLPTKA